MSCLHIKRPIVHSQVIAKRLYSSQITKDRKLQELRDRVIRVDHAGEYGANRIYAGQMAVLGITL